MKIPALSPSAKCLALIKESEGCKLKAYLCPAKVPTIGWGSTGPDIKLGMVWTQEQADARIARDVARFAFNVAAISGKCTQGEIDALTSFAYNCGIGALRSSTLLKKHLAGDHVGAAKEFLRWNKGGGRVLPGLVTRRKAEARLYLS